MPFELSQIQEYRQRIKEDLKGKSAKELKELETSLSSSNPNVSAYPQINHDLSQIHNVINKQIYITPKEMAHPIGSIPAFTSKNTKTTEQQKIAEASQEYLAILSDEVQTSLLNKKLSLHTTEQLKEKKDRIEVISPKSAITHRHSVSNKASDKKDFEPQTPRRRHSR